MKKLHRQRSGTIAAFEYYDEGDKCWKPRVAVVLARRDTKMEPVKGERPMRRGRWLTRCFDLARGGLRQFYSKRVRNVRVLRIVAAEKSMDQAKARAEGVKFGAGPGWGVVYACQDDTRVTHGLGHPHAVIAVKKQRESA